LREREGGRWREGGKEITGTRRITNHDKFTRQTVTILSILLGLKHAPTLHAHAPADDACWRTRDYVPAVVGLRHSIPVFQLKVPGHSAALHPASVDIKPQQEYSVDGIK
jgi:hypothetical protein